ncbi:MAG TPA: hypothetical protein VL997_06620 [Dyella sp.]|nr:hypothetical protein [Dyella sp.]
MSELTAAYVREVLNANGRHAGTEVALHHLEMNIRATGIHYTPEQFAAALQAGVSEGYWSFIECNVLRVPALQILK